MAASFSKEQIDHAIALATELAASTVLNALNKILVDQQRHDEVEYWLASNQVPLSDLHCLLKETNAASYIDPRFPDNALIVRSKAVELYNQK